uniref:Uncharacterized protein AlNc14C2G243 n=1 Tax=Albugo laibachii Nc14 TaxID=890382 RepID=F0VZA2_9STRA|nr:conserved hypothetical protein [Albugo laibachii Nc14]|eukprot:CCA14132.1 conserved hypothetical protein [Albugo laibachii Nc14]
MRETLSECLQFAQEHALLCAHSHSYQKVQTPTGSMNSYLGLYPSHPASWKPNQPELCGKILRERRDTETVQVCNQFIARFTALLQRLEPPIDKFENFGKKFLMQKIKPIVRKQLPITLVLPAFPAKSPNRDTKVLGTLPDRGEELALELLEAFCLVIKRDVYPIGCFIIIFSDGRVYNDLLKIPLENVSGYSEELRAISSEAGFSHILFDDLDAHTQRFLSDTASTHSSSLGALLKNYKDDGIDIGQAISTNSELHATYCALKRFLPRDLAPQCVGLSKTYVKKLSGKVARKMLARNQAFSRLIEELYPHSIRLSVHAYDNAGPKFGINLLPVFDGIPRTPWHCAVCENHDGSVTCPELHQVDHSRYELVHKRGRPWGFKEKAPATPAN